MNNISTSSSPNASNPLERIVTSRRNLIKVSASSVGGLTLSAALGGCSALVERDIQESGAWKANAVNFNAL